MKRGKANGGSRFVPLGVLVRPARLMLLGQCFNLGGGGLALCCAYACVLPCVLPGLLSTLTLVYVEAGINGLINQKGSP